MKQDDSLLFRLFTKGFLKVPNSILERMYAGNIDGYQYGLLYICLLFHANKRDKEVQIDSYTIPGKRGEWITTFRRIESKTSLSRWRLKVLLDQMVADGVIEVRHLRRFTVILLIGYDDWMKIPYIGNPPPSVPYNRTAAFQPVYKRFA